MLLHSLGATGAMWDEQAPALAERFRLIMVDLRGHGRSPVPDGPYRLDDLVDDLVASLDRLGVARAHLVGLSLGGAVALRAAAQEPDRVDRLAVLCTSADFGDPEPWRDRARTVRKLGGAARIADGVVARWFTPAFRERRPDRWAEARDMIADTPAEGYASSCDLVADVDLAADLGRIQAPTLVIGGAEDPATPPEHQERIAAAVPHADLLVVPAASHLASVERPGVVTPALLRHLG